MTARPRLARVSFWNADEPDRELAAEQEETAVFNRGRGRRGGDGAVRLRRVGPPLGSRRQQCLSRPSRGNGRTAGHGPSTRVVFGTHEPTQNRGRHRQGATDAAIDQPVFATALRSHDGAAFGAQHDLRVPTVTLVNIHMIENAGTGGELGWVQCRFLYARVTLSDIRQLLDVRQGAKSANPVF